MDRKGGALKVETVEELKNLDIQADFLGKPQNNRVYTNPMEIVRFKDIETI